MTKAKVGDRIRTTKRLLDEYNNGDEGEVIWADADGASICFPNKGRNTYIFDEDFVVISSKEGNPRKAWHVPKVGDKVRLINKPIWVGAYKEGDTGVVVAQDSCGFNATMGYILVSLDKGVYSIPHGQYEVVENDTDQSFQLEKEECLPNEDGCTPSAEYIRESILNIQQKRKQLTQEISSLEEVEKELHNKLAKKGFVMLSSESVTRYNGD